MTEYLKELEEIKEEKNPFRIIHLISLYERFAEERGLEFQCEGSTDISPKHIDTIVPEVAITSKAVNNGAVYCNRCSFEIRGGSKRVVQMPDEKFSEKLYEAKKKEIKAVESIS